MAQLYPGKVDNILAIASLSSLEVNSLPRTIQPSDHGKELIVSSLEGQITIPNDVSNFPNNFQVLVSLDIPGKVLFEREDGNQTDLIFTSNNQYLASVGEVAIRRRGSTNTFKITGLLSDG